MQNSKLIDLLKTFEKEDWRWFRKFLLSPYFNSREELVVFCDYLRAQSPDFKEKAIRKEKVFKKLYPNEIYDEKRISYAMNFLLGQAEKFLAQREIELQLPLVNLSLQKSLVKRQLEKHYNYQYDKSTQIFEDRKKENIDYYLFQYQKSEIANVHYNNKNLRNYDPNLQATSDELDQFYLIHKLKHCCEMVSRSKLMNAPYKPMLENEVVSFLETTPIYEAPLIAVYLETYFILKKEHAESNFEKLKGLLIEYKNLIPRIEKAIIYQYGINYCIFQMSKNNNLRYYAEQSLELYLDGIEQRILFNQGYLSPWHFKNVVKLGLNLKKYDFTEEFIQKHHKNLETHYQEDALHFNLADISYRKKNYKDAQIHLIQVQYSDLSYNLGAKVMLLKIYYEINEGEALFALIASFSIYLRRNKKLAKDVREAYLNFTNILGRIVRATKYKYPAIIEKINETKRLYNRNWLLEICQAR
ncbi:MAG: hypothetical protein AB8G86_11535 [Saprospiraceae bacterium]